MSMEGKEKCIRWIIYPVGPWFTLEYVKSHWAGPTRLMPHLDKERLRASDRGSRAWVGGETMSHGIHANLSSVGTEEK